MRLHAALLATPLLMFAVGTWGPGYGAADQNKDGVDLTGRWQLNKDLSDKPPQPGEGAGDASGRRSGGGPRGGPGGGGFPGGGMPAGGFPGGMGGGREGGGTRPNPEDMEQMRAAMRSVADAPAEMVVTRAGEEVVFTASGSGDVTRLRVNGQKRKTTAGGFQHDVKASYKDDSLVVESSFGPMTIVDTWRLGSEGRQLIRVTKMEGGRGPAGNREVRRIYERAE